MNKEKKDCNIKIRITKSEREGIERCCEAWGWTMSEFMRYAIDNVIKEDK